PRRSRRSRSGPRCSTNVDGGAERDADRQRDVVVAEIDQAAIAAALDPGRLTVGEVQRVERCAVFGARFDFDLAGEGGAGLDLDVRRTADLQRQPLA
ncbi:MAG: hypothetical protein WDN69_21495, partial [Aliidongia sp.]